MRSCSRRRACKWLSSTCLLSDPKNKNVHFPERRGPPIRANKGLAHAAHRQAFEAAVLAHANFLGRVSSLRIARSRTHSLCTLLVVDMSHGASPSQSVAFCQTLIVCFRKGRRNPPGNGQVQRGPRRPAAQANSFLSKAMEEAAEAARPSPLAIEKTGTWLSRILAEWIFLF